jgi:hypothetical protein
MKVKNFLNNFIFFEVKPLLPMGTELLYIVKKVIVFPGPSRDATNQTLPGRELLNHFRPGLVASWLGTGETITFFTV